MSKLFNTVNTALLHDIRLPLIILALVFLILVSAAICFVAHEIKKNKNDSK